MSEHPALVETRQYLRDELAELLLQRYAQAQKVIDDTQHDLDRLVQSVHDWHDPYPASWPAGLLSERLVAAP